MRSVSNTRQRPLVIGTRLSSAEYEIIAVAAESRGEALSQFMRDSALVLARAVLTTPEAVCPPC